MGVDRPPDAEARWLRLGPAAQVLGVSINTLRRWSDSGKIGCYRSAGGHRRFRRSDLDAILASQAGGGHGAKRRRAAAPASQAAPLDTVLSPEDTLDLERLRYHNRELELLVSAGIEDSGQQTIEGVLHSVSRRLSALTRSPVVDIYAIEGGDLRALVSYDNGEFDLSWEGTRVHLADFPHSLRAATDRRICVAASLDDPILTGNGRHSLEKYGYQSQLSSPLVSSGEVIGLLELSDFVPRDYAESLELIAGLSLFAARALENATLLDRLRRRTDSLHELVELGALVGGAHDPGELLRLVAQHLVTTLRIADCDIFTLDGDELISRVSYDRDGFDEQAAGHRLRVEAFPSSRLAIDRQAIVSNVSLDDPSLPESEREIFERFGYKASLTVPLVVDGVVRGLIDLYDDTPTDFAEHRDFLSTVARLVAGALQKTLLLERLEEGNRDLRLLVDSGLEFASSLQIDEVLFSAAERMRSLTGARSCEIYSREGDELVAVMSVDAEGRDKASAGMRYPISVLSMTAEVLERLEPVVIENAMVDERLSPHERDYWARWGFPSSLRLPLIVQGNAIGVVALYDNRPREFGHLELLQGIAQTAAQALQNARLLEQSRDRSAVLREQVELGALIWRTSDVDALVRTVAQRLTTSIGAATCDIFRLEGSVLRCVASYDEGKGFDESQVGTPLQERDLYPTTFAAIERGDPLVIAGPDDPRLTEHEREMYSEYGFMSELAIPLTIEDRTTGFIDIYDVKARDFTDYVDFLRSVGQMVAGAFENAALLERLNATNRELETLVESGLEFGASLDLDEVLTSIAARMREVSGAACCDIYALDGDTSVGRAAVDGNGIDPDFPGTRYRMADFARLRKVVESGEPVVIADIDTDPLIGESDRRAWAPWGFRSCADLPLMIGGRVGGFVSVYDTKPRTFDRVDLLQGLAQIAAQALANATLYSQLDESTRRLAVVNEASLDLASTLDFDEVLGSTARRLCDISGTHGCEIYVLEGQDLHCVTCITDGSVNPWLGKVLPLDDWYSEKLAVAGRSTVTLTSLRDPRRSRIEIEALKDGGYQSQLIVPLIAKDRVIGVAEVLDRREREFAPDVVATFEAVCRAAALAIDNANLFEGMQLRRRETELLNAIARRTAASLRIDEIAAATVEELRQLIPFDHATMIIKDAAGRLATIYSSDRWIGTPEYDDVPPAMAEILETVRRKRVIIWDAEGGMPETQRPLASTPSVSAATIALMRGDELVGIFNLGATQAGALATVDRRLLERVGTHLSLAINNARLYEEIKHMHLGNLKALSSALNAKDYYTLGHAARVAAYMVLLGHELGWADDLRRPGRGGGLPPRHRQDRRRRPRAAQAGRAERARVGADAPAPDLQRRDHPAAVRRRPRARRAPSPRALGRQRLPRRAERRRHPPDRPRHVRRRFVRRDVVPPAVPAGADGITRPRRARALPRQAVRRGAGRRLPAGPRPPREVQRDHARQVAADAAVRIDAAIHARLREPADEGSDDYRHLAAMPARRARRQPAGRVPDHPLACRRPEVRHHRRLRGGDPRSARRSADEIFADEELPSVFAGAEEADINVLYVDECGVDVVRGWRRSTTRKATSSPWSRPTSPPEGASSSEMEGLRSDVAQTFASMLQTTAARLQPAPSSTPSPTA